MTRQVTQENFEAWNEEMIRRFDPDEYHNHPSPIVRWIERRRVATILRLLDARADHHVLEVGCGAGNILEQVSAGELYGVDISDYILEKARRRLGARAELRKGDAEALPFEDGSFDRVFCSEVLEHVLHPSAVFREIHRVLKPDGCAVVSVPNERLINRLKSIVFRTGPVGRMLLRVDEAKYRSVERMEDEWHLHVFSRDLLRRLASELFHVEEVRQVPVAGLPLRIVARLRPR